MSGTTTHAPASDDASRQVMMTPTWVSTEQFRAASLPPICIHSGLPADEWVQARAKSAIGAQWLLLLLGIFPMVLVRALTIKQASGYLPVNTAAYQAIREHARARRRARDRKVLRITGIAVLCAFVVGGVAGLVWMVMERNEWQSQRTEDLANFQQNWDEVAAQLPFRTDNVDNYEYYSQHVETWAMDGGGCITAHTDYLHEDPDGYSGEDSTTQICRPEKAGFDGIGVGAPWDVALLPDSRTPVVQGSTGYNGQFGAYPGDEPLLAQLNVAVPFAAAGAAAVLVGFIGLLVVMFGPSAPPLRPKMQLDRPGERLYLRRVHPAFAEAAHPVVHPGSLVPAPPAPPHAAPPHPVPQPAPPQATPSPYGSPAPYAASQPPASASSPQPGYAPQPTAAPPAQVGEHYPVAPSAPAPSEPPPDDPWWG